MQRDFEEIRYIPKIHITINFVLATLHIHFCSVCRYRDGTSQEDSVVQWLWQTLESFTVEERVLFLRFVSGRSRLPTRVSEIPQRFQISVSSGQVCNHIIVCLTFVMTFEHY